MSDAIRQLTIQVDLQDNVTEALDELWSLVQDLVSNTQVIDFEAWGLDDIVSELEGINEAVKETKVA